MRVLKFGGTSVANAENIKKVTAIVQERVNKQPIVVVVSAFGGVTNKLLEAGSLAEKGDEQYKECFSIIEERSLEAVRSLIPVASQSAVLAKVKMLLNKLEDVLQGIFLLKECSLRTSDFVASFGEKLSSFIISEAFQSAGLEASLLDAKEVIITSGEYGSSKVLPKSYTLIADKLAKATGVTVVPGFIASNEKGITTTLGRGGSDYTAALIANAVTADMLEIWTDVSGMMTTDPRKVSSARPIYRASYKEAMELSHFGAKVIYPPTILPAFKKNIPILIKNTFIPTDKGTLITNETSLDGDSPIKGVSSIENISLLTLKGGGMIGVPGISSRLFSALSRIAVNVILITQASSEQNITFVVNTVDVNRAVQVIEEEFVYEMEQGNIDEVEVHPDLAIVAIVGDNMFRQVGVAGNMFNTLGQNGISVLAIAQGSSERNISAVIEATDIDKALNVLHEAYFSDHRKLNVFLTGSGNVGATFLKQVQQQQASLLEEFGIDVQVIGIANSKKCLINPKGINLDNWQEALLASEMSSNVVEYVTELKNLNLRNSIFVDCTATSMISDWYEEILKGSISIVTPNKIACSSEYKRYLNLKSIARKYRAEFLYETNVGAGLPVISTLEDLMKSGDKIIKIEAVLSGTLNFIFNSFDATHSFSSVVKTAKEEGYSEPDPREDLSGKDVMRKILILARESGAALEPEEVEIVPFVPQDCMDAADVPAFFGKLPAYDESFEANRKAAEDKGEKLRYMASFENGVASASLQSVGSDHPFYQLEGKDNIVLYYTNRYKEQPLVVKGAGAGAAVTAAGVFADVIRIAHRGE